MKIYKAMILIIIVLISLNQLANKKLVRDSSSINTIYLNASKFNNTSIYSQLNHETLSLVNPQSMINPPSIGESPKINYFNNKWIRLKRVRNPIYRIKKNLVNITSQSYSDVDWIINDLIIIENSVLVVNRSIIITCEGSLILRNSLIYMNLKQDGEHWIDVYGSLIAVNSKITAYNNSNHYYIRVFKGAKLLLDRCEISYAGNINGTIDQNGIWINTINATIRNTNIHHNYYGIILWNSTNNKIYNNTIENNNFGAYLYNSSENQISDNIIQENMYGIYLYSSNKNNLYSNTIRENYIVGIYLDESSENKIYENNVKDNQWEGIVLIYSNRNNIYRNKIKNNGLGGIVISLSNKNQINDNILVSDSLLMENSYDNTVKDNTVNGLPLIYLEDAQRVRISQRAGQIILVNCRDIEITNQDIRGVETAIELWKTSETRIHDNTIRDNNYGIYIWNSTKNHIYDNAIIGNDNGVYLTLSATNFIYNNLVEQNIAGIALDSSHRNIIYNNEIQYNVFGIDTYSTDANMIYDNMIISNKNGINLAFSTKINLYRNKIIRLFPF